jgi:hypothetical protein
MPPMPAPSCAFIPCSFNTQTFSQHVCSLGHSPLCLLLKGLCTLGFLSCAYPTQAFKIRCFALTRLRLQDFHHYWLDHHWDLPTMGWATHRTRPHLGPALTWENPRDFPPQSCSKLGCSFTDFLQHSCSLGPSLPLTAAGAMPRGFMSHASPFPHPVSKSVIATQEVCHTGLLSHALPTIPAHPCASTILVATV